LPDRGAKSRGGNAGAVRLAAVVGAVLLTLGGGIGVGLWLYDGPERGERAAQPRAFTCGMVASEPDPDYCRRAAIDYGHRAPVSDEQSGRAEAMSREVRRAAGSGGWCMGPMEPACLKRPSSHPPGPEDVEVARLWLARTGASDTTARLARPDDPAPVGSLLYAARVGDACIIGHVNAIPGGGGHHIGGLLPDGRCLSD
jgi:hypothetical protein